MKNYPVLGVCRLIVNYSNEQNYNISNLKLQKLLYFVQAYFLVKKGRPCFVAEIEAWSIGPVVPEAYKVFEQYGGCNIPMINNERIGRKITECQFKQADEKDIKEIIDVCSLYTASPLMLLICKQDPYKEANIIISKQSIEKYFKGE